MPDKKTVVVHILKEKYLKTKILYTVALKKDGAAQLCELFVNKDAKFSNIVVGRTLCLTACYVKDSTINITDSTKAYNSPKFDTDEVEKDLNNAEQISLSEANISPKKRRFSIEGVIEKVENVSTERWNRTDLTIRDGVTRSHVKLWDCPPVEERFINSPVKLINLVVSDYNGNMHIRSTDETKIIVDEEPTMVKVTVLGTDFDSEPQTILALQDDNEVEYTIRPDLIYDGAEIQRNPTQIIKIMGREILEFAAPKTSVAPPKTSVAAILNEPLPASE